MMPESLAVPSRPATATVVTLADHRRPAAPPPLEGRRRSDVDEFGRSERARQIARRAFDPLYRRWFRVEWEGLEHVPTTGGALLVANHAGAVPPDAPVIMHGIETQLGRPVYGLGDHLFRSLPVFGTAWNRMGGVVGHPDNAYRLLRDQGELVLVFPEGVKGPAKPVSERYRLRRFGRGGFVEIALRAGVPILPIAVIGAEEAMPTVLTFPRMARRLRVPYLPVTANQLLLGPLGSVVWFPAKVRVRVLPPVAVDVAPDLPRYSASKVMEVSDEVRHQIQEALHEMLRARRSIWFG